MKNDYILYCSFISSIYVADNIFICILVCIRTIRFLFDWYDQNYELRTGRMSADLNFSVDF